MNTLQKEEVLKIFGTNIRTIRLSKRLTQAEFAQKIGVSMKSLGSYEEFRATPNLPTLIQISDKLGVDVNSLLRVLIIFNKN